ncbi:helix-hairpin-helix domain-containing protein [Mangrovibacterium lignilyticum]|uniref:helix-hairpin-helix domain-containing protein n=1 Tax=Mangrovibacterium lignilyticum TaxID=2668052 RepID=UPI0013D24AD5|nr:helix-hairpin-helix domain-containing protein [Mangrovibacterium lignilyticum]
MKLRQIIQEYFSFTRGERIGLIVLIVLILLLLVVNKVFFYFEEPTPADVKAFNDLLRQVEELEKEKEANQLRLFTFDPNRIDSVGLARLDLPGYVKRNILSYRNAGGKFRSRKDLRRIYGMNDSIFNRVEAYIEIEVLEQRSRNTAPLKMGIGSSFKSDKTSARTTEIKKEPTINKFVIELNNATVEELEQLRGIGPVLSKRIVSYRNLIGGYVSVDQLFEVYGLKPEVVQENKTKLKVDTAGIRKLDLNFMTAKELAAHPYINFKDAQRIVDFRSKNGYISNNNILVTDSIIGIEQFQKLVFYLK